MMPKYLIGCSYRYAGATDEIEVEAETLEAAEDMAWRWAAERLSSWATEVEEDE